MIELCCHDCALWSAVSWASLNERHKSARSVCPDCFSRSVTFIEAAKRRLISPARIALASSRPDWSTTNERFPMLASTATW